MVTSRDSIIVDVQLNIEKFRKNLDQLKKNTKSIAGALSNIPFQAWALSALFFGMAIKRVFESIAKSAVSTFNEVIHSGNNMTTSFNILTGVFKFLAFTVGSALNSVFEPLIPVITNIVMAVAQWIGDNEKLVGWIIILGIVIGTLLMVFGTLVLGIIGLVQAFATLSTWLIALPAGFLSLLGVVALVAAAFLLIWVTNLGNFREFFTNTLSAVWITLMAVFGHIFKFLSNGWKALMALLNGDTDGFIKYTLAALNHLGAAVIKLLMGIGVVFLNTLAFVWNLIIDLTTKAFAGVKKVIVDLLISAGEYGAKGLAKALEWGINKAIEKVNDVIRMLNKIPGVHFSLFDDVSISTSGISRIADNLRKENEEFYKNMKEFGEGIKVGYLGKEDLARGFNNVDARLGLDVEPVEAAKPATQAPAPTVNIGEVTMSGIDDVKELLDELKRYTPSG